MFDSIGGIAGLLLLIAGYAAFMMAEQSGFSRKLAAAFQDPEQAERAGRTIVPLKLYFNDKGRAKLLIGVATGRKAHDKRENEAKRDWARDKARILKGG